MKPIARAQNQCVKNQQKQLAIMNCVSFCILYDMGWDADKIIERFNDATEVWHETRRKGVTTLELLENETGIELSLDGIRSWHDFDQFRSDGERYLTDAEYIYSLTRRRMWFAPMVLAGLILALCRKDGWDEAEITEFMQRDKEIRTKCGNKVENYKKYMENKTGFTPKLWGG